MSTKSKKENEESPKTGEVLPGSNKKVTKFHEPLSKVVDTRR